MAKDNLDNQLEGQMTLEDLFSPPERLIAVSRIFARARQKMSLAEQKTFVYALSQLKFTEKPESNIVYLDKKILANIIGINSDSDHLSINLHRAIENLSSNSAIKFSRQDKGFYDDGSFITRVTLLKNRVRIKFEEEYLSLFTGLSSNYITLWSRDIFEMNSVRSVQFYELLRQETDTRNRVNSIGLGVKALKEMFNIPQDGKGSYMREKGGFNRSEFEKKVIDPLCEDLAHCRMINLIVQPDGKRYEKVKSRGRVDGYRFYWTFTAHPAVASAEEVAQIQSRIDEEPEVLKVAKDIVNGKKKKPKEEKSGNKFNNFHQREYDYATLERELLRQGD